ncbi:hypothetical protein ACFUMH_04085 [Cellulomonas sp. NPDC057328]|uniref:hypothetical protein n=1 Tax=Cellulomonas sp. NPDC057328 TaxID=3346101 RepID=UPI0036408661
MDDTRDVAASVQTEEPGWRELLEAWASADPAWWTATDLDVEFGRLPHLPNPLVCERNMSARGRAVVWGQALKTLSTFGQPVCGYRIYRRRPDSTRPATWRIVAAASAPTV